MLDKNPMDQAAWLLKCKALTKKSWVDDLEIDEEGVADILMGNYYNLGLQKINSMIFSFDLYCDIMCSTVTYFT